MFGWLVIIAAVIIMVKAAEMERRSKVLWGVITVVVCLASAMFIPLPLINIVIGLVVSYLAMLAVNLVSNK